MNWLDLRQGQSASIADHSNPDLSYLAGGSARQRSGVCEVLDRRKAMAILPLRRLAFRPFFLAGCVLALLVVPLWLAAFTGRLSAWQPAGGWLAWHRHELLFGFGLAIIAGFLLTAVQTWTAIPGLSGKRLATLALLWLGARLAWLVDAPWPLLTLLELGFALTVAALMGGCCGVCGRSAITRLCWYCCCWPPPMGYPYTAWRSTTRACSARACSPACGWWRR